MRAWSLVLLVAFADVTVLPLAAQPSMEARAVKGGTVSIRLSNIPHPEELPQSYRIDRADGTIKMPYLESRVYVGGKTARQIEDLLTSQYKSQQIYSDPILSVNVGTEGEREDLMKRYIHVTGHVAKKMNFLYREGITLIEILVECGDITDFGSRHIQITRKGQTRTYDYFSARDRSIVLYPGDSIFVPSRSIMEGRPDSIGP